MGAGKHARAAARDTHAPPRGRYLFGALDVHRDWLRERKSARDVLGFLHTIRMRYPARQRIHLVMDNLSTHWTPDIRTWAAHNNVELVATTTYASFLNRIEAHFAGIAEFVIKNSDYPDWDTLALAMARHLNYRNGPHRDRRLEHRHLIAA